MKEIQDLITASRAYGADSSMVLAGGGNTSWKDTDVLYVKASGHALSSIDESGFVRMDMHALASIWDKDYPADIEEREEQVLDDMMAARCEGETARPSVEALLHSLIRHRYVIHMHPGLVNGLTCAQDGEQMTAELFGDDAIWIPLVNPGYILAKTVRDAIAVHQQRTGIYAQMIFLQNHGVFVSGDSIAEIDTIYERIMSTLSAKLVRIPDMSELPIDESRSSVIGEALGCSKLYSAYTPELRMRLSDPEVFFPIGSAFTPDHIVYSGFKPLWIQEDSITQEGIKEAMESYEKTYSVAPKTVAVQNTGIFSCSELAVTLFLDTVKVAAYTESFGGYRFMDDDQIDFIRNWEVEKYRAKVSAS